MGLKGFVKKAPVLLLIAGLILATILVSCSPSKKAGFVTIEFWTISLKPAYTGFINELIDEYEKDHPKVQVRWIDMPISVVMQKLMASIAGNASPDVVNLNSGYAQVLAQNQAIVCVDDQVPQNVKDLYFPGLWNAARYQGKNYAVPWYVTTRVLMYNKEIFRLAGLDPERPPKTWTQVEQYARIIKERTGKFGYMPAIKLIEDFQIHGAPVVSDDNKKALFNKPEGVAVLEWFVNLKINELTPPETLVEGYHGALDRYQGGKLAMIIAGPTLLIKIKADAPGVYKQTGVAPMPLGAGNVIPASTMNLVIPRTSRHKPEALNFALYVTNDHNQLRFCKLVPIVPSTKQAARDDYFRKGRGEPLQDKAIAISIDQLRQARDLSLGLPHAQRLNVIIKEAVEGAFYGRMTPKQALDKAAAQWNLILSP